MTIAMDGLRLGQKGTVQGMSLNGAPRRRLLDLGVVPGTVVQRVMNSPGGDPICFNIRGAMIALRSADATKISVEI